jgi:hypothetical protein
MSRLLCVAWLLAAVGVAMALPAAGGGAAVAVKPQLRGLLDPSRPPSPAYRGVVRGFVVRVGWAQLERSPFGPIVAGNPIDRALAYVRSHRPLGLRVKLRVLAGTAAPAWAKHLGGPPVHICDPTDQVCGWVGRFWTPQFGKAYQDLQAKLAARYDAAPEILETAITRCTTIYGEPLLRQTSLPGNVSALRDAGYSEQADQLCQREQLEAHRVWQRTRSALALNPYEAIGGGGALSLDTDFTASLMASCRQLLGDRCVLGNNSIRSKSLGPFYGRMYDDITRLGPPIYFQTASSDRVGNIFDTLSWAVAHGAGMVELPQGYQRLASPDALRPWAARFEGGSGA